MVADTCTLLVEFALNDLKPGPKITCKTIAELGNANRPPEIIVYQREGKVYGRTEVRTVEVKLAAK